MSTSDGAASGQPNSLGEKLLRLIPDAHPKERKPRAARKALLGQLLSMSAGRLVLGGSE